MNIPQMTTDLAVIQKLSDLPNTTDGLSAAALKAKFDEAALEIQRWINGTLLPALKAENIPFNGSEQLNADSVQQAVELVFEQVREASSGTITNGSVTKEKLAEELLARTFGGRPWVSLDKPTADCDPRREFPIGQLWLRPGFTVENIAVHNWTAGACTVGIHEGQITVTGKGEVAQASITQAFSGIGQAGDRVFVLFDIKDADSEITSLTVSIGGEEHSVGESAYETVLSGSSLSLGFHALWPAASLATGSFRIENLAVVNIDEILRQTTDGQEIADWGAYLRSLLPLDSFRSGRELYIQTAAGIWQLFDREVFPVERGGTGLSALGDGEMLIGNGTGCMERLPAPQTEYSLLQFAEGRPRWSKPEDAAQSSGFARTAEQTYTGTGKSGTVQLPGKPAVLWLRTEDQTHLLFQDTSVSGAYSGKYKGQNIGAEYEITAEYTAGVTLEKDVLSFWRKIPENIEEANWVEGDAVHLNEEGKSYLWTAIY